MIDLDKRSHRHYSANFYLRAMRAELTPEMRNYYLEKANHEEMLGNYATSENLRKLALGLRSSPPQGTQSDQLQCDNPCPSSGSESQP